MCKERGGEGEGRGGTGGGGGRERGSGDGQHVHCPITSERQMQAVAGAVTAQIATRGCSSEQVPPQQGWQGRHDGRATAASSARQLNGGSRQEAVSVGSRVRTGRKVRVALRAVPLIALPCRSWRVLLHTDVWMDRACEGRVAELCGWRACRPARSGPVLFLGGALRKIDFPLPPARC